MPPHIVVGKTGGPRPPLFLVHGTMGFSFFNRAFLDEVSEDRPIYLFQAPGLDGRAPLLTTLEEIASAYIASMRQIQPAGPYYIVGLCAGAVLALEMCNQLVEAGQNIARFILLDPVTAPHAFSTQYPSEVRSRGRNLRVVIKDKGIYGALYRISHGMRRIWRGVIPDSFEQELKRRAKKAKAQKSIRRRRAGEVDWASPEERSYSPEKMLEASQRMLHALRTHIPRPYAGKAAILACSDRATDIVRDGSFWRDHVGGIDWRVGASTHKDLFGAQIVETARFVRSAVDAPD